MLVSGSMKRNFPMLHPIRRVNYAGTITLASARKVALSAGAGQGCVTGTNDLLRAGQRFQIRCCGMHSTRIPRGNWRNHLCGTHATGWNTVRKYRVCILCEPQSGHFDLLSRADVGNSRRLAQPEGLLIAANQNSGDATVYGRDPLSGSLQFTCQTRRTSSPTFEIQ
jgi:hypothetical protein